MLRLMIFAVVLATGCANVPVISPEAEKISLKEKAPVGCENVGSVRSSCSIIGEEWKADKCVRNEFKEKVIKRGGNFGVVDSVIYAGFNREMVGAAYKCPEKPVDPTETQAN